MFLLAAWVRFPRTALAATLALTLVSDIVTVWWFPFAKNLSSWESIMYLSNGVSVSPLEITVVWALAVTSYRNLASTGRILRKTPLLVPFAAFGAFALFGLVRGLSRGGDSRAAIFEIRPLILLPLLYVLVVNVCRTRLSFVFLNSQSLVILLFWSVSIRFPRSFHTCAHMLLNPFLRLLWTSPTVSLSPRPPALSCDPLIVFTVIC